jgi:hypothetical protein
VWCVMPPTGKQGLALFAVKPQLIDMQIDRRIDRYMTGQTDRSIYDWIDPHMYE